MRRLLVKALGLILAASLALPATAAPDKRQIAETMKRATRFLVEKVATNGGYVRSYLDAYHATGDAYYYDAAEKAANALIAIQHTSGGWHYFGDFGVAEALVRQDRPQRLAARGIPARLGQCHFRRCRHPRNRCSSCSGSMSRSPIRSIARRSTRRWAVIHASDRPVIGISTGTYIENMKVLIAVLL